MAYNVVMSTRIAIIEDDSSIRELYRLKLTNQGYEVKIAENGTLGLALAKNFKPHVMLLDILMPEMNGDEMLVALREKEWGKDIKVVVMTNVSREEAPESLDNLEISRYIIKAEMIPGQVSDIIREIRRP